MSLESGLNGLGCGPPFEGSRGTLPFPLTSGLFRPNRTAEGREPVLLDLGAERELAAAINVSIGHFCCSRVE